MRRFVITFIAAMVVGSACARSLADIRLNSLKESHRIVYFGGSPTEAVDTSTAQADSIRRMIDNFYYDQFRHFQDPAAPYFLFLSKDAKLAMGIGGCVRVRGWYDWGAPLPSNGFVPYLITMSPDPTQKRRIGSSPAGTCLFYRVIGRDKRFGNYQLYIEANFNGYQARDFHLKKAYGIINDWTIGYTTSTFSDPAAEPPTVDAAGQSNKISPSNLLIRWMHTFRHNWTLALSLETPATAVSADNSTTKKVSEWLPDFAAFIQRGWGESEHIRLAGILRTLSYRDLPAGKNVNKIGWGLQLSSVWHPLREVTTYMSVNGGMGYESLGSDLAVGNYDLVPVPGREGELYAPAALGFCIGAQYNFTPSMFVSANYSQSRYLPRSGAPGDEYRYGQVMMLNWFWDLTARIRVGAELVIGMRSNIDGSSRWAHRAGALAQFSF